MSVEQTYRKTNNFTKNVSIITISLRPRNLKMPDTTYNTSEMPPGAETNAIFLRIPPHSNEQRAVRCVPLCLQNLLIRSLLLHIPF